MFTMHMEGMKELQAALRALPDTTAKAVMRRTLKKVAQPIIETAQQLAPEHDGRLKDSIAISTKLSKSQRRSFRKENVHDVVVFVGAGPLPQAHLQEYGTVNHPAQPFMRPAWDKHKIEVFENVKRETWDDIRRTVDRRNKKLGKSTRV